MSLSTTAKTGLSIPGTVRENEEVNRGERARLQTYASSKIALGPRSTSRRLNIALWIVQSLLAALFLFAGSTKLILPIEVLTSMGSPNQVVLPGWFIKFIGGA